MAVMAFAIEQDGETQTIEIDVTLDPGKFTLRELVRLEEVLGGEAMMLWPQGGLSFTPRVLQAMIWTKLVSVAPGLPLDAVDLPEGVYGRDVEEVEAVDVG
jgi:hypothetical protein